VKGNLFSRVICLRLGVITGRNENTGLLPFYGLLCLDE